jgi:hypothetical protein
MQYIQRLQGDDLRVQFLQVIASEIDLSPIEAFLICARTLHKVRLIMRRLLSRLESTISNRLVASEF